MSAHGWPIWYELMTDDADAATRFYEDVVGWRIGEPSPEHAHYLMINAGGTPVGGVLPLTPEMQAAGARPAWLPYYATDDVDQTVSRATDAGGQVHVPPHDLDNVGRFALLADPHGATFYVMRPATDGQSTAFAPGQHGHFGWNELWTPDVPASLAFYGALFGWENRDTMDMGPRGGYHFLNAGETVFGAAAQMPDRARWNLYSVVPDVDAAIERVLAGGGRIDMGPHDVPSGDRIIICTDPQGAPFSLVSRQRAS